MFNYLFSCFWAIAFAEGVVLISDKTKSGKFWGTYLCLLSIYWFIQLSVGAVNA